MWSTDVKDPVVLREIKKEEDIHASVQNRNGC